MRRAAVEALAKLPPEALTEYAPAIAKRLEDDR